MLRRSRGRRKLQRLGERPGAVHDGARKVSPMFSNFAELDLDKLPSLARGEVRAHRVRQVVADDPSLRGYGRLVRDFAAAAVTIATWPQPGWRPVVPGTGNEGGIVEDSFEMVRRGELQHAVNRA